MQKNGSAKSAKEIVISFLESLNNGDLKSARSCVSDDFSFTLPQGLPSFYSAETYFKAVEQTRQARQAQYIFNIKKIFTDGNDVCVLNDVIAGPVTLFACGWYHVEDQKIRYLKLVYDPRPLLQERQQVLITLLGLAAFSVSWKQRSFLVARLLAAGGITLMVSGLIELVKINYAVIAFQGPIVGVTFGLVIFGLGVAKGIMTARAATVAPR